MQYPISANPPSVNINTVEDADDIDKKTHPSEKLILRGLTATPERLSFAKSG